MPLDILGRTRATMACAESLFEVRPERTRRLVRVRGNSSSHRRTSDSGSRAERNRGRKVVAIRNTRRDLGLGIAIVAHERGIPSKRDSSYRVDYVPALCTHRPSLLPIGSFSEASGLAVHGRGNPSRYGGEVCRTQISRGSKSRNKVSVGEPAEGSLQVFFNVICFDFEIHNNLQHDSTSFRGGARDHTVVRAGDLLMSLKLIR
jgi:hypothetical protein